MPPATEILNGVTAIANDWRNLAVGWHVAFGALLAAIAFGWRPSTRVLSRLLILPFVSVSVLAWLSGNPFNAMTFFILALVLLAVGRRLPQQPMLIASPLFLAAGVLLTMFAWSYPHFLRTDTWVDYAYASPLGLIPCPTLSAVIGVTLIAGGFRSKAWAIPLVVMGSLYGGIGVFRLGISLDYGLIAGALVLGLAVLVEKNETRMSGHATRRQGVGGFAY
jgi:hypothetical protein